MLATPRLVDHIQPQSYKLHISVDLANFSFTAREQISFDMAQTSSELTFHAVGLDITAARFDGNRVGKSRVSATDQTITFTLEAAAAAGKHTLELEFSGPINDSLHGFYRSRYEYGGRKKWLATTQFEPAHAREAFVCIDEPLAKAAFELSLTVPADLTVISNTAIADEQPDGAGRKTVRFEPTPTMSTYLLAYIIGEFECLKSQTPDGITIGAYATPGQRDQLEFALKTAGRALAFFTAYFGLPYPLSKLDMIAVPDFAAGAMENWGAVMYRETDLLLDESQTSLAQKQRVVQVVTHELAHQWFGNLVTMTWWNDLWLNEGFAAWAETLATDQLFPEWNIWQQFAAGRVAMALHDDALANTHSIEVEVEDPRALDEIFDGISYGKGASIIHMLHDYLGAAEFRQGLSHYLTKYQYRNATTRDLWRALGEVSGKPVQDVMAAWTSLPGYPLLEFEQTTLNQIRFYSSPREAAKAAPGQVWPVPFSVITDQGEISRQLVTAAQSKLPAEVLEAKWFKPNSGQSGFYRNRYTPAMIDTLAEPLHRRELSEIDRLGVVSDVLEATRAGFGDSATALRLIAALRADPDYEVWRRLANGLNSFVDITCDEALRGRLKRLGLWFVQPNLGRLGWEARSDESSFDRLLRPLVLQQAVQFDDSVATSEAKRRFEIFCNDGRIDPDLRPAIFYAVARHGGANEFDELLEMYCSEQVPQLKRGLLQALCCFRRPELVSRSLELGLSKDVRPQDTVWTIAYGFMGQDSRQLVWQFLQDHWGILIKRYGDGGHMLSRIPNYVGSAFASHQMAAEVKAFFEAHPHPTITRPVAQAIETITLKADWYERDHINIEQFLTIWEAPINA